MSVIGRRTRVRLGRARPVVEAVIVLLVLLVCVPWLFAGRDRVTQLVLGAVLLAAIGVSWAALRDLVHGTFIKAGDLCRVGDRVAIDDKLGTVTRLGYRTLTLATDDGAEVFIPYGQLSRRSLVRIPRSVGVHRHGFEIVLGDGADPLATIERIKQLALSSHWSSVVRAPEIDAIDGRTLRVQVFALGREHGPAIEALVRRGL